MGIRNYSKYRRVESLKTVICGIRRLLELHVFFCKLYTFGVKNMQYVGMILLHLVYYHLLNEFIIVLRM